MVESSKGDEATGTPNSQPQAPWLLASPADLNNVDFEAPVRGSTAADSQELGDLFNAVTKSQDGKPLPLDTAGVRIFVALSAVTGMHFRPQDANEPFGPMMTLADGRRTAIPADFRGAQTELLAAIARRASNPVLRARTADIAWILDKKLADLGETAIRSYVQIIQKVDAAELTFRFQHDEGALEHVACEHLRRALDIGRAIGWDKPVVLEARNVVVTLRERALKQRNPIAILWFYGLDLDFGISEPTETAAELEKFAEAVSGEVSIHIAVDLWTLAARAYHSGKRKDDRDRCRSAAAERRVIEAEELFSNRKSAMLAAHELAMAIRLLHGIPGKKERRIEFRHRLIDIQAQIVEEMSEFSHEIDVKDIVKAVRNAAKGATLLDKFFIFVSLIVSPAPEKLIADAQQAIREHPLGSLFSTVHLDDEGKTIHRTEAGGFGDGRDEGAERKQISQTESIRRQLTSIQINDLRQRILESEYLADGTFTSFLQYSPFVPPDLLLTFCHGFLRFFQGDFVSATYILVPLLENSLRYVLKNSGHDVTTFDDASLTQEDRTISALFEQMRNELEAIFGQALVMDIENTFLAKHGPHLRHALAHGLLADGSPYGPDAVYSCALIFRLCLLPLYPMRDELRLP